MNKPRPPKKTETLEVRVPHSVKRDFMDRARSRGRTASGVLREFIDAYLAGDSEDRPMYKRLGKPAAATAVIGTIVAAHLMLPTAAAAAPDFKSVFDQLDRNRDGKLSPDEFAGNGMLAGAAYVQHEADLGHGAVPLIVAVHSSMLHASGEPSQHAQAALHSSFAQLDGDGNGVVTFGEFEARHLAMVRKAFDSLDADQDGKIGRVEYDSAMKQLPDAGAAHPDAFGKIDANHDGTISWEEFLG